MMKYLVVEGQLQNFPSLDLKCMLFFFLMVGSDVVKDSLLHLYSPRPRVALVACLSWRLVTVNDYLQGVPRSWFLAVYLASRPRSLNSVLAILSYFSLD